MFYIPSVLRLQGPSDETLPIIYDSPHSGDEWPDSFKPDLPRGVLLKTADPFVDKLFDQAPLYSSYFLYALFPRCYVDANRRDDDIDTNLISENEAGLALSPREKSRFGHGLIWRLCPRGNLIYKNMLSSHEIAMRIERYWQPYHTQLETLYDRLYDEFGHVFHINCHSMPAKAVATQGKEKQIDIVLSDLNGKSCAPRFRDCLYDIFTKLGFNVALNKPYIGDFLIKAYAKPKANRHSIQIEINRALYMDEQHHCRNKNFNILKSDIKTALSGIMNFVKQEITND